MLVTLQTPLTARIGAQPLQSFQTNLVDSKGESEQLRGGGGDFSVQPQPPEKSGCRNPSHVSHQEHAGVRVWLEASWRVQRIRGAETLESHSREDRKVPLRYLLH